MRNIRRLSFEIKILERIFWAGNIAYPSDGRWIKISNYRLPQTKCVYNFGFITILIMVPEEYDSVGVSECYIDKDLKIKNGTAFYHLPHVHGKKFNEHGYQWLCFHASSSFVGLLDFINTLKFYFTDPFQYQSL